MPTTVSCRAKKMKETAMMHTGLLSHALLCLCAVSAGCTWVTVLTDSAHASSAAPPTPQSRETGIICAECAIMSAATLPLQLQQQLLLPRSLRLRRYSIVLRAALIS